MYYGAIVQHRREGSGVGYKHFRAIPKEEQMIIEGMYEPIVSKETFEQAQLIFRKVYGGETAVKRNYPLKSQIKCAV